MTEQEKMLRGFWYDANFDADLLEERLQAAELYTAYNKTGCRMGEKRREILEKLLGSVGSDVTVLTPFCTDYGYNCHIGSHTFLNRNAYLMDPAPIRIGRWCFIGPDFGCYTSEHALLASERNKGYEQALPVTIEDNVWIGGSVTILGGVTIGEGSVIGAGSVVTKNIPAEMIAAGNPCRPIRPVTQKDSIAEALVRQEVEEPL